MKIIGEILSTKINIYHSVAFDKVNIHIMYDQLNHIEFCSYEPLLFSIDVSAIILQGSSMTPVRSSWTIIASLIDQTTLSTALNVILITSMHRMWSDQ